MPHPGRSGRGSVAIEAFWMPQKIGLLRPRFRVNQGGGVLVWSMRGPVLFHADVAIR